MEISAKVLAHSKSNITGKEIVTFEIVYPRMILAELNTHRLPSKNSASSRAIPIAKVIEQVRNDPAMPVHFGKNQPGMSAREELGKFRKKAAMKLWGIAAKAAAKIAGVLDRIGAHKQVANRILEPFQYMKTIITSTEWDNFYHLRNHPDADPNIQLLAKTMLEAYKASVPVVLEPGEWHTPYFGKGYWREQANGKDRDGYTLADALAISSSCSAQTSFRTSDDSLDKAQRIFEKLVESKPVHASPFEHQATPMLPTNWKTTVNLRSWPETWQEGITHIDRAGKYWSANFCGFIQHRQLIPDNACWNYKEYN